MIIIFLDWRALFCTSGFGRFVHNLEVWYLISKVPPIECNVVVGPIMWQPLIMWHRILRLFLKTFF